MAFYYAVSSNHKNRQCFKIRMRSEPPMSVHARIYWQHMADHVPSELIRIVAGSVSEAQDLLSQHELSGELVKVKDVPNNITTKGYVVYGLNVEGNVKEPFVYGCNTCHKYLFEAPRIVDYDDGRGKGYDVLCIKCNNVMSKHTSRWG